MLTIPRGLGMFATLISHFERGEFPVTGVIIKPGEPFEKALKRWSKSCEKSGIISDVKKKQRYEKPSEVKKRKITAARRKAVKEAMDLANGITPSTTKPKKRR